MVVLSPNRCWPQKGSQLLQKLVRDEKCRSVTFVTASTGHFVNAVGGQKIQVKVPLASSITNVLGYRTGKCVTV